MDLDRLHLCELCVQVLHSTPEDTIVCVSPFSFVVYRLQPLSFLCHGELRLEECKGGFRQVVLYGDSDGETLTDATQQEVIECWYSYFVADGQRPYAIQSNTLDAHGNVVREITRTTRAADDDKGVN